MSASTKFYLAYGSNLHPYRLTQRVPSAKVVGVVPMIGKRLAFHKLGADGSGKCLFADAPDNQEEMYGVVYEFISAEKRKLDGIEGLGKGYGEQRVAFPLNGETCRAYTYVASSTHIDSARSPYHWYKNMVLLGARYHRFPPEYISQIELVRSIIDRDPARASKNEAIVERMRRINITQGC